MRLFNQVARRHRGFILLKIKFKWMWFCKCVPFQSRFFYSKQKHYGECERWWPTYYPYVSKIYEQSDSHLLEWGEESAQKERKNENRANGRELKYVFKTLSVLSISKQAVPCRNHQPICFKGLLQFKLNHALRTEAIWSQTSYNHRDHLSWWTTVSVLVWPSLPSSTDTAGMRKKDYTAPGLSELIG